MMRELTTQRLSLRHIREEDAQRIFDCWASKPEVTKYLTWYAHERVEQTKQVMGFWLKEYEEPTCMRWGIELRATGELIGMIDVVGYHHGNPVIGYCSGPAYWGNGYMTEALKAVVKELFECGYEEIVIEAVRENIGSNRVIEKAGFAYVGSREEPQSQWKPEIVTIHSYRLRKETNAELFIPEMKDLPACAQTYISAYSVPPWNEAYDGRDIEKYIAEYLTSDALCCYALRNGKEMIGIALGLIVPSLAAPYLRIEDFCIRADWQGKGMGSLLMKLLAEKARERGCDSIMLGTQRDYPSHRFYLKNDFVEIESALLYRAL